MGQGTTQFVLYSKPGCHLCEGLADKLAALGHLPFALETRDITTRPEWFEAYQYEIPVLCRVEPGGERPLPRLSPRASVAQVERWIQNYLPGDTAQ